ncbi:MAG: hypothetical protein E6G92_05725 [Alphaproteobacteria bacterium]|nr:MAG: hypothetical protein E6G92_05725 [Alphaproteobacteria bacterium]
MRRPIFLAAALLAACATVPPAAAGPVAGLGQVASVEGIRIRPLRVIEDSRCPANANCVWAGRLVLRAEVQSRGRSETRDLTLGVPIDVEAGRLTLAAAEPNRIAGREADPAAYRFTFSVEAR